MAEKDRIKWDEKYRSRQGDLGEAESYLKECYPKLASGRILDIGAGEGRNTRFLLKKKLQVCAVDISSVGLERLKNECAPQSVETLCVDLETNLDPACLGIYHNLVMIHYLPPDDLWRTLINGLASGGVILFCTFNEMQHEKTGFSLRFCVQKEQLINLSSQLELLDYQRRMDGEKHHDAYLFRKF